MLRRRMMLLGQEEEMAKINDGTFIGDGTDNAYITVPEEPDIIFIRRENTDLPGDAVKGVLAVLIMRDEYSSACYADAASTSPVNGGYNLKVEGLYSNASINADYSNGILHVCAAPAARKFAEGVTYKWKTIKYS